MPRFQTRSRLIDLDDLGQLQGLRARIPKGTTVFTWSPERGLVSLKNQVIIISGAFPAQRNSPPEWIHHHDCIAWAGSGGYRRMAGLKDIEILDDLEIGEPGL